MINKRNLLLSGLLVGILPFFVSCKGDHTKELLGKTAPNLDLYAIDQLAINFSTLDKPAIIYFFGLWCPICEKDKENWNEAIRQLKSFHNVELVQVHVGNVPSQYQNLSVWQYHQEPILRTNVIDDTSAAMMAAFGVTSTPTLVVLDKNHTIVHALNTFENRANVDKFIEKMKTLGFN